jgi:PhnB protein
LNRWTCSTATAVGGVKDPSGNTQFIATHKEDVGAQDLQKRAEEFYKQQKSRAA